MAKLLHQVATFHCQLLIVIMILEPRHIISMAQHNNQPPPDEDGSSSIFNDTSILSPDSFSLDESHTKCQQMQIRFCEKVDYNKTALPNSLGHQTQADVESEINVFYPLMTKNCSPNLRLFLCSVYAPICFEHDNDSEVKLLPCQSLCESARNGCASVMREWGREWPPHLQCDKFPNGREKGVLCVGNDSHSGIDNYESEITSSTRMDPGFVCPKNFEVNSYTLHFNGRTYNNCAMPCENVYLDKNATGFVRLTTVITAIICLISSLFACVTFLIDTKRFQYPARPIIIIAFCQFMVATCYLVGFLTSNKIACNDPADPPKSLPNLKMIRTTTMGNRKGSCTLLFMALYFFQMSAVLWWLMMTVSWYMIAKLKWGPESVSSIARYFHFTSWTVSALLTLYLSVLGDIEGDSLSGTCFVSTSNQESIKLFIIAPIAFCLALGMILLSLGFKSIWDSRETLKSEYRNQIDEHYKLVIRIGLYSSLFIMFALMLLFSYYYEQINQTVWKFSWLSNICKNRDYSIPCPRRNYSNQGPHYSVFMIKYFASMAIGLVSVGFMLSEKTVKAYRIVAIKLGL